MAMVSTWLQRNWRIYFGNAASVRDFRSQLRGNRALILWGSYLAMLIFVSGLSYASIVENQTQSIAEVQSSLRSFYQTVTTLLGVMIMIVAPAMTAGSIVMERQRRSIDLVLTTPVEPKYLLVGKMLSSYRYVWMLLVLSLPVTSTCVVMGGATWYDVLSAYIMLSAVGIIFTSIGLLMSTLAPTIVSAMMFSYLAIGVYAIVTSFIAATTGMASMFMSSTLEVPWVATISPFGVALTSQTFTVIRGVEVPNWIFDVVFALAISKVVLLGAASNLSPYGAVDTKSLRVHGVLYSVLIALLFASSVGAIGGFMAGPMGPGATSGLPNSEMQDFIMAATVLSAGCLYFLALPIICCHGPDGGFKHRDDGSFSIRKVFVGTPSGALPFLILMWLGLVAGSIIGFSMGNVPMPGPLYWIGATWILAVWFFWWAWARYVSSFNSSLRSARGMLLVVMILFVAIPVPILSMYIYNTVSFNYEDRSSVWMLHMLYPGSSPEAMKLAPIYDLIMIVGGIVLLGLAALKTRARAAKVPRFEV